MNCTGDAFLQMVRPAACVATEDRHRELDFLLCRTLPGRRGVAAELQARELSGRPRKMRSDAAGGEAASHTLLFWACSIRAGDAVSFDMLPRLPLYVLVLVLP